MAFGGMMNETITTAPVTSQSSAGEPTYGTKVTQPARVEKYRKTFTREDATAIQSTHRIACETKIAEDAIVWLPGDDTTKQNEAHWIVSSDEAPGLDGLDPFFQYALA